MRVETLYSIVCSAVVTAATMTITYKDGSSVEVAPFLYDKVQNPRYTGSEYVLLHDDSGERFVIKDPHLIAKIELIFNEEE